MGQATELVRLNQGYNIVLTEDGIGTDHTRCVAQFGSHGVRLAPFNFE
jgi:hypothetical protein